MNREVEAETGVLSPMVDALKRYLDQKLQKVEQTFLSAHIHQTPNLRILCPGTPRLAAVSPTGKRTALSIESPFALDVDRPIQPHHLIPLL